MKNLLFIAMLALGLCMIQGCKEKKPVGAKAPTATIETDLGTFVIEFYPEDAPNTVKNFITLAKKGYYEGVTFHRIVPGFVIQGGDPDGTGVGGPGYSIAAEFNSRKHDRGAVAMARKGNDVNSAGSQFYVTLAPQPFLDGKYTVFGHVTQGMDVVDKIAAVRTGPDDKPLEPVRMKKVTIQE